MATPANVSYPTLVPTAPAGGGVGLPSLGRAVPAANQPTDRMIRGALVISAPQAPFFVQGGYTVEAPRNNALTRPPVPNKKTDGQEVATEQGPVFKPSRPWSSFDPRILWGSNKEQKPVAKPWIKKYIPPLALFNDASQWVNILQFVRPMLKTGRGNSMPDMKAQYFSPPPILVNNFAAGTLNVQLQLGNLAIQAQQLTMTASNYFGGS